jgi:hypothetical protein
MLGGGGRHHGALPRLPGRGEQGDVVSLSFRCQRSVSTRLGLGQPPEAPVKTALASLPGRKMAIIDRGTIRVLSDDVCCSPRPGKQGSAPRFRLISP